MVSTKRLEVALSFAAQGCRIYVARHGNNHPMEEGWRDTATTDEAVIRKWWEKYDGCNFGMLCDDTLVCCRLIPKTGRMA